jgi:hypothetical protein
MYIIMNVKSILEIWGALGMSDFPATPSRQFLSSVNGSALKHKLSSLPKYCRECEVRFACHGECPRNRFITTPDGEPGLNSLCAGYKAFFNHIHPAMKIMAGLLRQGRFADEIMQMHITQDAPHGDGSDEGRSQRSVPVRE